MSIDAPIIDEFDEDSSGPRRRSNWGFSSIKRTIAKSQLSANGMIGAGNTDMTKGDIKAKRKSWKDLANIREYLEGIDKSLQDVVDEDKKAKLNPSGLGSGSQERRRWFTKLRFQQQLVSRLTGIEKNLKGKGGKGLGIFGLLGSMGAIGTLLKTLKGKGLGAILSGGSGGVASGITKEVVKGILTALLAKSALGLGARGASGLLKMLGGKALSLGKGGISKAKTFGSKALSSTGTFLKAGKARLLTAALPSMGLGGLAGALGNVGTAEGGAALTSVLRSVLPKVLARVGMAVFGIPGAVAMTAKLVWDHLLPESWKKYITYKVAKFYLSAIDKVAKMFEWISDKFESIKNAMFEAYNKAIQRIYAAMNFVGDLITGEGDARQRVKAYMSRMWNSLELTVGTYISGFVSVFKNAYNSFIKPFYDSKGNFSLIRGINHYAKSGYDLGVEAVNRAGNAVDSVVASTKKALGDIIDSNYNPANWQRNSEAFVKKYEQEQALKAKNTPRDETGQLIAKTQDATRSTLDTLEKTLRSTNKYLQVATNAANGMIGSFSTGYNNSSAGGGFDGSGAPGVYTTDGTGGGLGTIVGHAESKGNYNAFNRGNAGDSRAGAYDFTNMTIGQIMNLQRQGKVFAVGKYQVIPDTMKDAVKALNLGPNSKFTPDMQEYIFQNFLVANKRKSIKSFVTGQSNNLQEAQMSLAREFASIGVPYTGREGKRSFVKGGSYYAGEGNNKASVSDAQSAAALREARAVYAKAKAEGKSDQEAWNAVFRSNGGKGLTQEELQSANANVDTSVPSGAIQANDPIGAIVAAMQNPETARKMYEDAKLDHSSHATGATDSTGYPLPSSHPVRVSSIGSQINEDIRYPDDIGVTERARREAIRKAEEEKSKRGSTLTANKASTPVAGSSQNALFSRINMANVYHENAFPV